MRAAATHPWSPTRWPVVCLLVAATGGCAEPRRGEQAVDALPSGPGADAGAAAAMDAPVLPGPGDAADLPPDLPTTPVPPGMQRLVVTVQGPGRVNVDPINGRCESKCQFDVPKGTTLTLVAIPDDKPIAGAVRFMGWAEACTGPAACQLTLDADRAATARFHRLIHWEQRVPTSASAVRGDDLYLAGTFTSGQTISGQSPFNHGMTDGFFARYSMDGSLRWLKTLNGPLSDRFASFVLPPGGDILLTGAAQGADVIYDGKPLGVTGSFRATVSADGELRRVFAVPALFASASDFSGNLVSLEGDGVDVPYALVKRGPDGAVSWSRPSTSGGEFLHGPYLDTAGNIYVAHTVKAALSIAGRTFTPEGGALLVKFSPGGEPVWAIQILGFSYFSNIRFDDAGDVYLSFSFSGQVSVGGRREMSIDNGLDSGILKLTGARGDLVWLRTFATFLPDMPVGFTFDGDGRIVGYSSFYSMIKLGADTFPKGDLIIRLTPATGDVLGAFDLGLAVTSLSRHASGDFVYRRYQMPDTFIGRMTLP